MSFHVKPDSAGHFILPRVPPMRMRVALGTKSDLSEGRWVWNASKTVQVEVHAGETAQVTFDGEADDAKR
jgi:hypothetical protein